nr:histone-lysine N-methyltransferase family member SUVH9-like [Tanacetum cinerariifolium]
GIHGVPQAGIDFLSASMSLNKKQIVTSVIVSGGYEDDEDSGEVIVYTGHGGQDKNSKLHVVDQKLEGKNLGMERSMQYGIEFKLVRMEGQPEMGSAMLKFAENIKENPIAARPMGYVSLDISMNKENVPVFLFNDIKDNNEPVHYEYLTRTVFSLSVYQASGNSDSVGCFCVDVCGLDCACAKKNGVYSQRKEPACIKSKDLTPQPHYYKNGHGDWSKNSMETGFAVGE